MIDIQNPTPTPSTQMVQLINLSTNMVVMWNNTVIPITKYLDKFEQEVQSYEAEWIVAGPDSQGQWYSIELGGEHFPPIH